jgi:hypothetical protein
VDQVNDLTTRLEQTWAQYKNEPRLAEIVCYNMVLKAQIDALTPQHTAETFSRARLAIEAIDRTFGEFLVSKEGGE